MDAPIGPKAPREKITQMLFETFNVPAMYIGMSSVLALYSIPKTTGIVLDSGDGVTRIIPVYEGNGFVMHTMRVDTGGRDVTEEIRQLLIEKDNRFNSDVSYRQIAEKIKHQLCYVAADFEEELERTSNSHLYTKSFTLPDGKIIELGPERLKAPEILFKPHQHSRTIAQELHRSIQNLDKDLRSEMYRNIVLVGGNTMFPGYPERIVKEVTKEAFSGTQVKVTAPNARQYSGWIGGSVLSVLSTFQQQWITKEEYEESGPSIVHRKCS